MNPGAIQSTVVETPELWMTLLKSLGMLSLVIGVLLGVLYLTRQLFNKRGGLSGRGIIRMLASYHISPKERVVLMDVLGEKILLGVTPQQIRCLAKITTEKDVELLNDDDPGTPFARFFKDAVTKRFRNR